MVLRPQEDPSTSPLTDTIARTSSELLEFRSQKAAASLIAEESSMPKSNKREEKAIALSTGSISEQMAAMRIQMNKLDKELRADNEELRAANQELRTDNQHLKALVNSIHYDLQEVKRLAVLIASIHLRVLLDWSREIIVDQSGYASWDSDLCNSCNMYDLKRNIASTHGITSTLASFIFDLTNVRRDGNEAAHIADRRDIQLAVLQKPEGAEWHLLEQLSYRFVFSEDINSTDLNE